MAKKVVFDNDQHNFHRQDFQNLDDSRPTIITKTPHSDEYEIYYNSPRMMGVSFKLENGQVIITAISHISV
jgi:hypothetical protein